MSFLEPTEEELSVANSQLVAVGLEPLTRPQLIEMRLAFQEEVGGREENPPADGIPFSSPDEDLGITMIDKCREFVMHWYYDHDGERAARNNLSGDDIYVVWWSKILQNHKAMLASTLPDGRYFEVTYDGDKDLYYLDAYAKSSNEVFEGNNFDAVEETE